MFSTFDTCTKWAINILRSDQEALSSRYAIRGDHLLDPCDYQSGVTGIPVMPATLVTRSWRASARIFL